MFLSHDSFETFEVQIKKKFTKSVETSNIRRVLQQALLGNQREMDQVWDLCSDVFFYLFSAFCKSISKYPAINVYVL